LCVETSPRLACPSSRALRAAAKARKQRCTAAKRRRVAVPDALSLVAQSFQPTRQVSEDCCRSGLWPRRPTQWQSMSGLRVALLVFSNQPSRRAEQASPRPATARSRTRDTGPGITRECVTRGRGTRTCRTYLLCPVADVLQINRAPVFSWGIYHDANNVDRWFSGGEHRARGNVRSVGRPSQRCDYQ